jgi:Multicopper oxidase
MRARDHGGKPGSSMITRHWLHERYDTIPVPPRDADGNPGRVFVSIPFKAREQVGRFVFHCHILEHEDGGMMAPVEVLGPETVAQQQYSEPVPSIHCSVSVV